MQQAHQKNVENGIRLPYPFLPPEELRAKIENRGVMFVALTEGRLVALGAVIILNKNLWCGKGLYGYSCLDAVLPGYEGRGLYRAISMKQEEYVLSKGVTRIFFDTHERNTRMIELSKKSGYELIEYKIRERHNSVLMVKWLRNRPYSHLYCLFKYMGIMYKRKFFALMKKLYNIL